MAQTITTKEGQTWDFIALQAVGSEFALDSLISANAYAFYDTLTFSDGDLIEIPADVVKDAASVQSAFIPSPWSD